MPGITHRLGDGGKRWKWPWCIICPCSCACPGCASHWEPDTRDILLRRGFGCCETFTMVAVSRGMQESTIGCRGGADIACSHYCICSENPRLIRRQLLLQIYWKARKYESTGQATRHSYSTKTNLFEHEKPVGEENRGVLLSRQAPCKGVS